MTIKLFPSIRVWGFFWGGQPSFFAFIVNRIHSFTGTFAIGNGPLDFMLRRSFDVSSKFVDGQTLSIRTEWFENNLGGIMFCTTRGKLSAIKSYLLKLEMFSKQTLLGTFPPELQCSVLHGKISCEKVENKRPL